MAKLKDEQLRCGAASLRLEIESLLEDNRELSDFHEAFEQYGAKKFALGSSALTVRIGGKNQKGIDFYSQRGGRYHIGQCKMPDESGTLILSKKYGPLDAKVCRWLLGTSDVAGFTTAGEVREAARSALSAGSLEKDAVVSRVFCFLRYVTEQFWAAKSESLVSTSRIRTVLIKRSVAAELKREMFKREQFKTSDEIWKPKGMTFLESLPPITKAK
jgi:hypothetical protein